LSSEIDNSDKNKKLRSYIAQAQKIGITVGNVSVNKSGKKFLIERGVHKDTKKEFDFIRSPITMLDGVGAKASESIVENQPYVDSEDFLKRVDTSKVSSKVFIELVRSGSMDSWKRNKDQRVEDYRSSLLSNYESVKKKVLKEKNEVKKQKKQRKQYSGSLFDSFETIKI